MKPLRTLLAVVVGVEVLVALCLVGWRLNSTRPVPPPVDEYTDAITGRELLEAPDRFLFDGAAKWRTLGEAYMASGFFSKGEACFERAAHCAPRSAKIALLHGDCLERLGLFQDAAEEFRRAAGLELDAAPAWHRLGRIYLQQEDPIEAERAFERAGDDHLASVYQRARLLIRGERAAQALDLLDRIAERASNDLLVWRRRAEAFLALGETALATGARDAAERADVTLQLDEAHARLVATRARFGIERELQRALAENEQGRHAAAALRLLPLVDDESRWWNRYPSLLEQAAQVQLDAGDVAGARALLERQIEEFGLSTPRALELHGAVEFLQANPEQAWRDWGRSEQMHPAAIDHRKLARIAERQGDVRLARHHRGLALQFAAFEAFRSNRLNEARSGLREALAADPNLPNAWFYLGESERALGELAAARAAYEHCLKLDPCHGRAWRRLRSQKRE